MTYNAVDTSVSVGDTVELGETLETVEIDGGRLQVVSSGAVQEYVVLKTDMETGDLDLSDDSHILGVRKGKGIAKDQIIYAVSKEVFGE